MTTEIKNECENIFHEENDSALSETDEIEIINGTPTLVDVVWCGECIENKQHEAEDLS